MYVCVYICPIGLEAHTKVRSCDLNECYLELNFILDLVKQSPLKVKNFQKQKRMY